MKIVSNCIAAKSAEMENNYKIMFGSGTDSPIDLWGRTFGPFK